MVDLPKPTTIIVEKYNSPEVRKDKPSTNYVIGISNYYKKLHACKTQLNCEVVK